MVRSLGVLASEIAAGAADLDAALCRWLGLVAEFDRREGWAIEGARCCSAWVAWRCGLSPAAARDRVRVARRLAELDRVRAAFAAGELSYSKVRALTRIEGVAREAELVELARSATAAQLERMVSAYRGVVRAEQGVERIHSERSLTWTFDEDGSLLLRGRLPAEQGAVVVRALEAAREEARRSTGASAEAQGPAMTADVDPVAARNPDALVAVADSALASTASRSGGDRFQVVVHVDAETLVGGGAAAAAGTGAGADAGEAARCELDRGPALAPETVRRLACDASVVSVVERDGSPLSVGRKTRSIPPAIGRALRARDGGCRFPGCDHHRHVDAHHVEHWAHGGQTALSNLVLLCRHHHRLVHEGGFAMTSTADGPVFRRPDGRPLGTTEPRRPGARARPARASAEALIEPAHDRMHLGYAIEALLEFAPLAHGPEPPVPLAA